ncbi:hypothetical protein C8Q74DRAFT_1320424 [Fomes fomentarius]|nr:hypothetical protein C8Q74DRAFT_1320424 [Fomes fomentarius]
MAASDVFRTPYEFHKRDLVTLVELRMRKFSNIIRQKPRWWEGVNDSAHVARWRAMLVKLDQRRQKSFGAQPCPCQPITDDQLDYVFDELKWAASQVESTTGIHSNSVYGVYQSSSLIPKDVKQAFISAVAILESVPQGEKDWHPGSNRQVLDLVDPSLYCLRIGASLFNRPQDDRSSSSDPPVERTWDEYKKTRKGEYGQEYEYQWDSSFVSQDFQWLPTDFAVATTGEVTCQGYINNLHPIEHRVLYPPITSVLQRFIPMFEKVLSDAQSPEPPLLIHVDPYSWYDHHEFDWDDWDDSDEACSEYGDWYATREPFVPEPPCFEPPSTEGRIEVNLKGRTLQVIVKLANIVLTPKKPKYPGGKWHVEGMLNERIVATGFYYYACKNITKSRLAFRAQVGAEEDGSGLPYDHNEDSEGGYLFTFGFTARDQLNQGLGHVVAVKDKCIAFSNRWQHRVKPFELVDRSKRGVQKILSIFLVDPSCRVHSTSDVPPQQRAWYENEMERIPALRGLPTELYDMIASSPYIRRTREARRDNVY